MYALPYDNLDMGVLPGESVEFCEEEGAGVMGRGPAVATLKDKFSYVGDEGDMSVGGEGAQLTAEEGSGHCE